MRRTLQKLSMLLLTLVVGMGSAWAQDETIVFSSLGFGNSDAVTSIDGTDCTITFEKGSNTIAPSYYNTGAAIRAYAGNTVTVSSEKTIEKIVLSFGTGDNTNSIKADVGNWDEPTWTGNSTSVTFTIDGSTKHRRITSIAITYASGGVQKTSTTVTYKGEAVNEVNLGDDFTADKFEVRTADGNAVDGAELTYTSSNEEVATVDEAGSVTIVGAGTTTITATYGGDDNYYGSAGSYTLKVVDPEVKPLTSLYEAFQQMTGTATEVQFAFDNVVVTGATSSNAYIEDGRGYGAIIYNKSGHGFTKGDVLNGTVTCNIQSYKGALEFTGLVKTTDGLEVGTTEPTPTETTLASLDPEHTGKYVTLSGLTYVGSNVFEGAAGTTEQKVKLYDAFKISLPELEEGAEYTITGVYIYYEGTGDEIAPLSADDIVMTSDEPVEKADAVLDVFSEDGEAVETIELKVGETFSFSVSGEPLYNLTIAGDNDEVATVETAATYSGGTITAVAAGTMTLTLTTDETEEFKAGEKTITVTVTDATVEDEYNTVTWTLQQDYTSSDDTEYAEWTHRDVKLTYEKYNSNTTLGGGLSNLGHTRFYQNTKVSIVPGQGVEIAYVTFTTLSSHTMSADQTAENATIEVDGTAVKLIPEDGTQPIVLVMAKQVRAFNMTVYYTGEAEEVEEKADANISIGEYPAELAEGETATVSISSRSTIESVESSDESVATIEVDDNGAYVITAVAKGTVTFTVKTAEDDYYKAGKETFTITVTGEDTPYEVTDGVFDFSVDYDYGSGVEITSDGNHYETSPTTWTAGNIKLVADGKYRWWEAAKGNTLRFYTGSSITVSAPEGYVITTVKSNVALTGFAAEDGELSGSTWTGYANTVTLTKNEGNTVNIGTLTVTYKSEAGTYTRDVTAGTYGTLCLESAATVEGAVVYDVAGTLRDETGAVTGVVLVEHDGVLLPGAAYVVLATADQIVATFTDDTVDEIPFTGLVGNLSGEDMLVEDDNYVLSDGKLRQVAGGTAYVAPNRAYFDLAGVDEYVETAGVKAITVYVEGATGIKNLATENAAQSDAIYNVNGQLLNTMQRGINIVGGKKVLVK